MLEILLEEYAMDFALVEEFGAEYPEIMPTRRARNVISRLPTEPPEVQKIFRKRFGRWFIHIPSLIEHMESEESIL